MIDQIHNLIERSQVAEFVAIQPCFELGENLILLRHKNAPRGAVIGIHESQLNDLSILLAVTAQIGRYETLQRPTQRQQKENWIRPNFLVEPEGNGTGPDNIFEESDA